MSKGYTYILRCSDGSYYTGSTRNIDVRLYQHQTGDGAVYTKKRRPVELVYVEEYERIDEAFYREKQIQGWSRRKKEALIAGNFDTLSRAFISSLSLSKGASGLAAACRENTKLFQMTSKKVKHDNLQFHRKTPFANPSAATVNASRLYLSVTRASATRMWRSHEQCVA